MMYSLKVTSSIKNFGDILAKIMDQNYPFFSEDLPNGDIQLRRVSDGFVFITLNNTDWNNHQVDIENQSPLYAGKHMIPPDILWFVGFNNINYKIDGIKSPYFMSEDFILLWDIENNAKLFSPNVNRGNPIQCVKINSAKMTSDGHLFYKSPFESIPPGANAWRFIEDIGSKYII